jgi:hypothetical protein
MFIEANANPIFLPNEKVTIEGFVVGESVFYEILLSTTKVFLLKSCQ